MPRTGSGVFFDGVTSARHEVLVELGPDALRVVASTGAVLAEWRYAELARLAAHEGVLRLGRVGNDVLARLEICDGEFAAAINRAVPDLDRTDAAERRRRKSIVVLSMAAMASLVLLAVFGVPLLASQLTPFVPQIVERRLGEAVDTQVRSMLDKGRLGPRFECGTADAEKPGRAALDRLVAKLAASAGLQVPLAVAVVRRREPNAIALPGGHIYVFQGLVAKADSADELAGVLAHEVGHIAHRDGTRAVLQAAGLSLLFGMLLGDFVGGGAVVVAARTVLQSSYSRDVEAAADTYGVGLMAKIGGNPRALATMLSKIEPTEPALKILLDHPETKDRVDAINAAAPAGSSAALLDPADWAALKRICTAR